MDIKPDNVGYSHYHKKFVLIDFGFSEFIQENVGEKTLIHLRGTYFYMSKEMNNAHNLNQPSLIDLYDNDMFALKYTIETFNSVFYTAKLKQKMMNESSII